MNTELKHRLKDRVLKSLYNVPGVISVTMVGSFVDREDFLGISDIDTIVICEKLSKQIYNKCLEEAEAIPIEKFGLNGFRLKINASFGPLKFDEQDLAVIHLMIYDLEGHKNHVLASPFTCLDWERSDCFLGKKLSEVFPVGRLQPRDFLESRRGLKNYLEDLKKGIISIREYDFKENRNKQIKKTYPLDDRHMGEYAYHIIRNLVSNGIKLKCGENRLYSMQELESIIPEFLQNGKRNVYFINNLYKLKEKRSKTFPNWTFEWIEKFVMDFQIKFVERWKTARTIYFVRHSETYLNDRTFLGQSRDPGILSNDLKPLPEKVKTIYTSPSKRCVETAKKFAPQLQPFPDKRLHEIQYGNAEGYTFEELEKFYPEIVKSWSKGGDPYFPGGGENTGNVSERLMQFINEIKDKDSQGSTLVVTHNVVLRCLIGHYHSIALQNWHKLTIPHAEPLEFKMLEGRLYSNIPRTKLGVIFKRLGTVQ